MSTSPMAVSLRASGSPRIAAPPHLVFGTLTSSLALQVALPTVFARAGPRSQRCVPDHYRAEGSYFSYTQIVQEMVDRISLTVRFVANPSGRSQARLVGRDLSRLISTF